MAFDRNLLFKESQSEIDHSKAAKWAVENFVVFALRVDIEYANDKDEVAIVDFEENDFIIFVEFKRLQRKRMVLFSEINVIRKKLNAHLNHFPYLIERIYLIMCFIARHKGRHIWF